MKKIAVVSVLIVFFVNSAFAEVITYFSYQNTSKIYIKFVFQFGNQFLPRVKKCRFVKDYKIKIVEGVGSIELNDGTMIREEAMIVAFVNEEKIPAVLVRVKDLTSEKRIKEMASQFSDKLIKKLRELEKMKDEDLEKVNEMIRNKIAEEGGDEK